MLCTDRGIILGSTDGDMLGSSLGSVDGIELEIDERIDLDFSDGSFDGSNKITVLGSSDSGL